MPSAVSTGWEDVQRQLPAVRMRLIGRPPGERMLKGQQIPCFKTEDAHCGWAWGTPYAGAEVENGIDELGYLSAEELLKEVSAARRRMLPRTSLRIATYVPFVLRQGNYPTALP